LYLHIGNDIAVPFKDIIAIIDLETSGRASTTKDFLKKSGYKAKKDLSSTNFKSCVITDKEVFYSTISSGTLLKRTSASLNKMQCK